MPRGSQQRKREATIVALLRGLSHEEAAKEVGISVRTLGNWLADPVFRQEYNAARRQTVEKAIEGLQALMPRAVKTLRENLTARKASDSTRTALGIIDRGIKGAEILDLQEQLKELRAMVEKVSNERRSNSGFPRVHS